MSGFSPLNYHDNHESHTDSTHIPGSFDHQQTEAVPIPKDHNISQYKQFSHQSPPYHNQNINIPSFSNIQSFASVPMGSMPIDFYSNAPITNSKNTTSKYHGINPCIIGNIINNASSLHNKSSNIISHTNISPPQYNKNNTTNTTTLNNSYVNKIPKPLIDMNVVNKDIQYNHTTPTKNTQYQPKQHQYHHLSTKSSPHRKIDQYSLQYPLLARVSTTSSSLSGKTTTVSSPKGSTTSTVFSSNNTNNIPFVTQSCEYSEHNTQSPIYPSPPLHMDTKELLSRIDSVLFEDKKIIQVLNKNITQTVDNYHDAYEEEDDDDEDDDENDEIDENREQTVSWNKNSIKRYINVIYDILKDSGSHGKPQTDTLMNAMLEHIAQNESFISSEIQGNVHSTGSDHQMDTHPTSLLSPSTSNISIEQLSYDYITNYLEEYKNNKKQQQQQQPPAKHNDYNLDITIDKTLLLSVLTQHQTTQCLEPLYLFILQQQNIQQNIFKNKALIWELRDILQLYSKNDQNILEEQVKLVKELENYEIEEQQKLIQQVSEQNNSLTILDSSSTATSTATPVFNFDTTIGDTTHNNTIPKHIEKNDNNSIINTSNMNVSSINNDDLNHDVNYDHDHDAGDADDGLIHVVFDNNITLTPKLAPVTSPVLKLPPKQTLISNKVTQQQTQTQPQTQAKNGINTQLTQSTQNTQHQRITLNKDNDQLLFIPPDWANINNSKFTIEDRLITPISSKNTNTNTNTKQFGIDTTYENNMIHSPSQDIIPQISSSSSSQISPEIKRLLNFSHYDSLDSLLHVICQEEKPSSTTSATKSPRSTEISLYDTLSSLFIDVYNTSNNNTTDNSSITNISPSLDHNSSSSSSSNQPILSDQDLLQIHNQQSNISLDISSNISSDSLSDIPINNINKQIISQIFVLRQALSHQIGEKNIILQLFFQQQHRLEAFKGYIENLQSALQQTFEQRTAFELELHRHMLCPTNSSSISFENCYKDDSNINNNNHKNTTHNPMLSLPAELHWLNNALLQKDNEFSIMIRNRVCSMYQELIKTKKLYLSLEDVLKTRLSEEYTKQTMLFVKYSSLSQIYTILCKHINDLQTEVLHWKKQYNTLFSIVRSLLTHIESQYDVISSLHEKLDSLRDEHHKVIKKMHNLQQELQTYKQGNSNNNLNHNHNSHEDKNKIHEPKLTKLLQDVRHSKEIHCDSSGNSNTISHNNIREDGNYTTHIDNYKENNNNHAIGESDNILYDSTNYICNDNNDDDNSDTDNDNDIDNDTNDENENYPLGEHNQSSIDSTTDGKEEYIKQLPEDLLSLVVTQAPVQVECFHCTGLVDVVVPWSYEQLLQVEPYLLQRALRDLGMMLTYNSNIAQYNTGSGDNTPRNHQGLMISNEMNILLEHIDELLPTIPQPVILYDEEQKKGGNNSNNNMSVSETNSWVYPGQVEWFMSLQHEDTLNWNDSTILDEFLVSQQQFSFQEMSAQLQQIVNTLPSYDDCPTPDTIPTNNNLQSHQNNNNNNNNNLIKSSSTLQKTLSLNNENNTTNSSSKTQLQTSLSTLQSTNKHIHQPKYAVLDDFPSNNNKNNIEMLYDSNHSFSYDGDDGDNDHDDVNSNTTIDSGNDDTTIDRNTQSYKASSYQNPLTEAISVVDSEWMLNGESINIIADIKNELLQTHSLKTIKHNVWYGLQYLFMHSSLLYDPTLCLMLFTDVLYQKTQNITQESQNSIENQQLFLNNTNNERNSSSIHSDYYQNSFNNTSLPKYLSNCIYARSQYLSSSILAPHLTSRGFTPQASIIVQCSNRRALYTLLLSPQQNKKISIKSTTSTKNTYKTNNNNNNNDNHTNHDNEQFSDIQTRLEHASEIIVPGPVVITLFTRKRDIFVSELDDDCFDNDNQHIIGNTTNNNLSDHIIDVESINKFNNMNKSSTFHKTQSQANLFKSPSRLDSSLGSSLESTLSLLPIPSSQPQPKRLVKTSVIDTIVAIVDTSTGLRLDISLSNITLLSDMTLPLDVLIPKTTPSTAIKQKTLVHEQKDPLHVLLQNRENELLFRSPTQTLSSTPTTSTTSTTATSQSVPDHLVTLQQQSSRQSQQISHQSRRLRQFELTINDFTSLPGDMCTLGIIPSWAFSGMPFPQVKQSTQTTPSASSSTTTTVSSASSSMVSTVTTTTTTTTNNASQRSSLLSPSSRSSSQFTSPMKNPNAHRYNVPSPITKLQLEATLQTYFNYELLSPLPSTLPLHQVSHISSILGYQYHNISYDIVPNLSINSEYQSQNTTSTTKIDKKSPQKKQNNVSTVVSNTNNNNTINNTQFLAASVSNFPSISTVETHLNQFFTNYRDQMTFTLYNKVKSAPNFVPILTCFILQQIENNTLKNTVHYNTNSLLPFSNLAYICWAANNGYLHQNSEHSQMLFAQYTQNTAINTNNTNNNNTTNNTLLSSNPNTTDTSSFNVNAMSPSQLSLSPTSYDLLTPSISIPLYQPNVSYNMKQLYFDIQHEQQQNTVQQQQQRINKPDNIQEQPLYISEPMSYRHVNTTPLYALEPRKTAIINWVFPNKLLFTCNSVEQKKFFCLLLNHLMSGNA